MFAHPSLIYFKLMMKLNKYLHSKLLFLESMCTWVKLFPSNKRSSPRLEVSMSISVTYSNRTPIFERCVVGCESKNKHQKDMCLKEIGLHASKHANHSRLNSQLNWGDLFDLLMVHCQWTFSIHNNVMLPPKFRGIDHGFFKYLYGCTNISISRILSV